MQFEKRSSHIFFAKIACQDLDMCTKTYIFAVAKLYNYTILLYNYAKRYIF